MKKSFGKLKVAVYYDWLTHRYGGAENVLIDILKIFPQADIFTLFHNPKIVTWIPGHHRLFTSFIHHPSPIFSPLYDIAIEKFDVSQYDLLISTTTNVGHCFITSPYTLFICFYHNLNRHLYRPHQGLFEKFLKLYRQIDKIYAQRPDFSFCNSFEVKNRLKHQLNINATVIHPGVDTSFFRPLPLKKEHFLAISRLVPYKNLDLLIGAFNQNKHKLIIVGEGREKDRLHRLSQSNIKFIDHVSSSQLRHLYCQSKALIYPQIEDFGLTAIEAQSCGTPVIAFGQGGATETIIDGKTGIFFNSPTIDSINEAISKLMSNPISQTDCRNQAIKFSRVAFMINFKNKTKALWRSKKII